MDIIDIFTDTYIIIIMYKTTLTFWGWPEGSKKLIISDFIR